MPQMSEFDIHTPSATPPASPPLAVRTPSPSIIEDQQVAMEPVENIIHVPPASPDIVVKPLEVVPAPLAGTLPQPELVQSAVRSEDLDDVDRQPV